MTKYKGNIKQTWNVLKEVINKNRPNNNVNFEFNEDNSILRDPKIIADRFNSYFVNVGPNLAKNIPNADCDVSSYLKGVHNDSFFVSPVTENELLNFILKEKENKASGYDEISIKVVKYVAYEILVPLTVIFNVSFTSGIVPNQLKIAKVLPLFKSGDKACFTNYRPVSVLPIFSKLLEKMFQKRLLNFVNKKKLLYNGQYGFREKSCTSYAIIDLLDQVTSAIENGKYTIGVCIDLRKAFDTVDHSILLKKLQFYGIRGVPLNWLKSYLCNRKQFVLYNGTASDMMNVKCGVPQGSILGPLLFLLYINDLSNISELLKSILFADDTNIFASGKDLVQLQNNINSELCNLVKWFKVNKLSLNISKTNFIVFSSSRKVPNHVNISIVIDGIQINRVSKVKFLGVILDESLTWCDHIFSIENKISKCIGVLYRIKDKLNAKDLYILYCSLILPYLNYCIVLWGNNSLCRLNRITVLQKRALRIVGGLKYLGHTTPIFVDYNCLKFVDLVAFHTGVFMFNVFHRNVPENLLRLFELNSDVHKYQTRNSVSFHQFFAKTKIRNFHLRFIGPKIWNSIPDDTRLLNSLISFKILYKKVLMTRYV